jgi:hypothetical protein
VSYCTAVECTSGSANILRVFRCATSRQKHAYALPVPQRRDNTYIGTPISFSPPPHRAALSLRLQGRPLYGRRWEVHTRQFGSSEGPSEHPCGADPVPNRELYCRTGETCAREKERGKGREEGRESMYGNEGEKIFSSRSYFQFVGALFSRCHGLLMEFVAYSALIVSRLSQRTYGCRKWEGHPLSHQGSFFSSPRALLPIPFHFVCRQAH